MDSIGGGLFGPGQLGLFRFAYQTTNREQPSPTGLAHAPATAPPDMPAAANPPVHWQDEAPSRDAQAALPAPSLRERADAAEATFAQQLAQIHAARSHIGAGTPTPPPERALEAGQARSAAELEAMLANFATPADMNGDHRISAMESLTFSARQTTAPPAPQAPMAGAPPVTVPLSKTIAERIAAMASESYQAMRSLPQASTTTGAALIHAAV